MTKRYSFKKKKNSKKKRLTVGGTPKVSPILVLIKLVIAILQ